MDEIPVDFTVYLPDYLGQRYAAHKDRINLSRLLRAALEEHFAEEDAMNATIDDATEVKLRLEDDDGRPYVGRIRATKIASDDDDAIETYLTDEANVVVYDRERSRFHVLDDAEEELRGWYQNAPGAYTDAMFALGVEPIVDLGV